PAQGDSFGWQSDGLRTIPRYRVNCVNFISLPMPLALATTIPGEPEIFASLQGEGASAGKPCAFIRLSRCNLACQWCDPPYTWHFDGDNRPHRGGETYDRKANQVMLSEREA